MDKKLFRQDKIFSTRLPYANKKIREIFFPMVNTNYKTIEKMVD